MYFMDLGSFYRVTVPKVEVEAFKNQWPCSGLPDSTIWFEFDKRNGDLVDLKNGIDGKAAVALSNDARDWAEGRIGK